MNTADVSVIIPVYNGERYLQFAIDSILSQTRPPKEVIIVDDGSTDQTRTIVDAYQQRLVYLFKAHSGIARTLNLGIQHAQSNYVAFLDADDLWIKEKLDIQLTAIREHSVDMVFGYIEQFVSPELSDIPQKKIKAPDTAIPGYSRDTLIIKRESLQHVGAFSTDYRIGEFIEWYARAKDLGLSSLMLPDILVRRRIHHTNTTSIAVTDRGDYARLIKSILDHRRSRKG